MKKVILLLVIFPAILSFACQKKDLTDTTDISQFSWKVKNFTINGDKNKIKKGDFHNSKAYILRLESDSTFTFNNSMNVTNGSYRIMQAGNINISDDLISTKIAGENEIDKKLFQIISKVTSYQVLDEYLILKGEKFEIKFQKEK